MDEALTVVQEKHQGQFEAELYRLKGEALLTTHDGEMEDKAGSALSPEACFVRAIETARRRNAKSQELRAVMSLSRLWQGQGKKEAARQMLAEIYDWFNEGFDTADWCEAKVLLESLA